VLWLHSHLSFFHYSIANVGHLLPWITNRITCIYKPVFSYVA